MTRYALIALLALALTRLALPAAAQDAPMPTPTDTYDLDFSWWLNPDVCRTSDYTPKFQYASALRWEISYQRKNGDWAVALFSRDANGVVKRDELYKLWDGTCGEGAP